MMSNSDASGPDPLVGQIFLERYRVVRKLEERSGAGVYYAQHMMADRPVAVEGSAPGRAPLGRRPVSEESAGGSSTRTSSVFNGGRRLSVFAMEHRGHRPGQTMQRTGHVGPRADRAADRAAWAPSPARVVHGDLAQNVLLVPAATRDFVSCSTSASSRPREGPAITADVMRSAADLPARDGRAAQPSRVRRDSAAQRLRPQGTLPADVDSVVCAPRKERPLARRGLRRGRLAAASRAGRACVEALATRALGPLTPEVDLAAGLRGLAQRRGGCRARHRASTSWRRPGASGRRPPTRPSSTASPSRPARPSSSTPRPTHVLVVSPASSRPSTVDVTRAPSTSRRPRRRRPPRPTAAALPPRRPSGAPAAPAPPPVIRPIRCSSA